MSTTIGLVVVLAAVLAQAAVIPAFSIFGAQPNAVLVLLVAWMSVRGRREALVLIPAAGLAQGLIDSQELGVAMLALAPLILMTTVRDMRLVESDLVPAIAITAIGTLVYETVVLLTLAVRGEHLDWLASTTDVLVPATIANVLLLLPLYGVLRLASPEQRQRPAY